MRPQTRPPRRTPSAPLPLPPPTAKRPYPRFPIRGRANLTILATFGPEPRVLGLAACHCSVSRVWRSDGTPCQNTADTAVAHPSRASSTKRIPTRAMPASSISHLPGTMGLRR